MNRPIPPYLKVRASESLDESRADVADLACLGELCQAFAEATGWPLRYVNEPEPSHDIDLLWSAPVNPGVGVSPGHLRIDLSGSTNEAEERAECDAVQRMAGAIAELINELVTARHALWQREAELAAGVPVSRREDEPGHLAARLEATLRAGARAIGCDSAALYLLDEATSQLKLRSAWGLSLDKFAQPARRLAEQMADLEALLGHAVALESPEEMVGRWQPPEAAAAAVCVPVSSPTIPLGTLWFFSKRPRPFTDEQTNLAEVIAGKIASDLDRAVLLEEGAARVKVERQLTSARLVQEHQLPVVPPPITGWTTSGWAAQAGPVGGAFYDWRMLDDRSLLVMLGDACDEGIDAALAAAALRAALHAEQGSRLDIPRLFARANRVLWECSSGQWRAGLWMGLIDLPAGSCDFAAAGRPSAIALRSDGWTSLLNPTDPLGPEPTISVQKRQLILEPGQSLVVCNRGVMETSDHHGRPLHEADLGRMLLTPRDFSADQMVEMLRKQLGSRAMGAVPRDRSILVVKRLPA